MSAPKPGFFRCYSCATVIYLTWSDLQQKDNTSQHWDYERGDLYVNNCPVCHHWRHYEPLGDFKRDESSGV